MLNVARPDSPEQHQSALLLASSEVFPDADTERLLQKTELGILLHKGMVGGMVAYKLDTCTDTARIEAVATTHQA